MYTNPANAASLGLYKPAAKTDVCPKLIPSTQFR